MDAALAARLGLFADEYPGFREARLFQAPDSSYVLEYHPVARAAAWRGSASRFPRWRPRGLRSRVGGRVAERAPRAGLDQGGRDLLLLQTTLVGLGFYGWAVPVITGAEDAGALSLSLITVGSSFFLPLGAHRGAAGDVRHGEPEPLRHHAAASPTGRPATELLAGDGEGFHCEGDVCFEDGPDERTQAATALVASVGRGGGRAPGWARGEDMTAGRANAIGLGGDFGLAGGLGLAYLAGTDDIGERATAAFALPAAAAGIYAGHRLSAGRDVTWGDADVVYTAGALGVLAGFAAADLLTLEERPLAAAGMLGGAAGLYLGGRHVRGADFTVGQASLNRLGAIAGGLVGLGVGSLVSVEDEDPTAALTGAAAGAALG